MESFTKISTLCHTQIVMYLSWKSLTCGAVFRIEHENIIGIIFWQDMHEYFGKDESDFTIGDLETISLTLMG